MSKKHFSFLLILTMVVALLAALLVPERTSDDPDANLGPLFPLADTWVNDVEWLRIVSVEGELRLTRRDAQWQVDALAGYPADWERLRTLLADLAQAERDLTAASGALEDANTTIAMIVEATGYDVSRGVGAPQIDGAVLQYRADQKLVHINRGTNDKVKRGYVFDIFSGGVYKGQARVEVVNPDTCTAVVTYATSGTEIAQGDLVSTQI